ncbi:hypothetical protein [Priestia megaterium]|nr:hypothetical protein [Priestia megaterium]USL31715.1 hypothetical protein LIT30_05720 [Priestia megaterium]
MGGCGDEKYSGKADEDISSGESFIASHFNGCNKEFSWGIKAIGDNGGV